MVAGKRLARLNEQLKRELSELIRTEVRDPRVGSVTITDVEVARDLGSAKVFVRTVGEDREATLQGLAAAAPFLRTRLGRGLRIRRIPELRFREDRSLEHARRIEDVLEEVARDEEADPGEEAEPGEEPTDQDREAEPDGAPNEADGAPGEADQEPPRRPREDDS